MKKIRGLFFQEKVLITDFQYSFPGEILKDDSKRNVLNLIGGNLNEPDKDHELVTLDG